MATIDECQIDLVRYCKILIRILDNKDQKGDDRETEQVVLSIQEELCFRYGKIAVPFLVNRLSRGAQEKNLAVYVTY